MAMVETRSSFSTRLQVYRKLPLRSWIPWLVLGIGILSSIFSMLYIDHVASIKEQFQFTSLIDQAQTQVVNQIDTQSALLSATAGLFLTDQNVSSQKFHTYTRSLLAISERYPGIQAIGYSIKISEDQIGTLSSFMQQQGEKQFHIFPSDKQNEYTPVLYIYPNDSSNQSTIGFNMSSEPTRNEAMQKARDLAQPTLSAKTTLLQTVDNQHPVGFLLYQPIYSTPDIPTNVDARRTGLRGYVYSPFRAQDFFLSLFRNISSSGLDVSFYDGTDIKDENLLYRSADTQDTQFRPRYESTQTLVIAGRQWTVRYQTNNQFPSSLERSMIPFVFVIVLGATILLFALTRAQYSAQAAAQLATEKVLDSQAALRRSEELYRLVVENSHDLITIITLAGDPIYHSPSHTRVLGYPAKELEGLNIFSVIHPDDVQAVRLEIKKAMRGNTVSTRFRIRHKRGQYLILESTGTIIFDQNKEPVMLVATSRDITQQLEMDKRKDDFIGVASHELKTPVTSLRAYAQVLQKRFEKTNDEASAKLLGKMNHQLNKLMILIRDLLDVSRIESGKFPYVKSRYVFDDLVADIVEEVQTTTDKVRIEIKGQVGKRVEGDKERTGQVLTNLLSNAVKYSKKSDKVLVVVQKREQEILVEVRDFGLGIPKTKLKKIFGRFVRVEEDGQQTFPGLGLGLYISSRIVKRQGGKIWVESTLGEGSRFFFTVPLIAKE